MAETNWEIIKTEYITTDISQRKLAAKYNVPMSNLKRRSKAENWVDCRNRYKSKVVTKTLEKSANRESNRLARLMDTTSKAIDVVVNAFEDEQQFNRYLIDRQERYAMPDASELDENGEGKLISERKWTEEHIFRKTDTKALKELTAALKDLTGLMRDFYNIPTPAQAEAQRIAAERLDMDKKKAESADDNDVNAIEVVFEAGPDDWNE